jgi:prepilin-type N-terminal cleavage/methylation domain-containing protein/prepilin-type processing-associated H-X9-DG protein
MKRLINNPSNHGFTLIEVLAAIGILALLIAVLLPSLIRPKENVGRHMCRTNMRQIVIGILLYADENKDLIPWAPGDNQSGRSPSETQVFAPGGPGANAGRNDEMYMQNAIPWGIESEAGSVFPFVTGGKKQIYDAQQMRSWPMPMVYRCPTTGVKGEVLRVNYSLNKWTSPLYGPQPIVKSPGIKAATIVKPMEKILLIQEKPEFMRDSGFAPGRSFSAGVATADTLMNHNGKGNLCFADGHIEQLKIERIKEMMDGGTNTNNLDRYWNPLK